MAALSASEASGAADRVLQFPADRAVGTVESRPTDQTYTTRWESRWKGWSAPVEARGAVRVPADREAKLKLNLGHARDLSFLRALPPGVVVALTLQAGRLSDENWAHVLSMATLRQLWFDGVEMNEASLEKIRQLASLRDLGAGIIAFGNALTAAAAGLPGLESLQLGRSGLTDAGVAHISRLTGLKDLYLGSDDITDAGFAKLATLVELEELHGWELPAVGDAGAAALAGMRRLRTIELMRTGIGDAGVAHVAGLTDLRSFRLSQSKLTDAGVAHLARLPRLESLDISGKFGDDALRRVGALRSLRKLALAHTSATDAGVAALAGLTDLEELNIGGTAITDAGAAEIAKLRKLKTLWLQNCQIGDAGFARIIAANPRLERLQIHNIKITDAGLALLPQLKHLADLGLGLPRGSKACLKPLAGCTGLTALSLRGELADESELAHLLGMTKLERLDLQSPFGDAGAEHIAALANLKNLSAWSATITDAGLARIARLSKLEYLQIGGAITDEGLASLAALRNLTYLNLNSRTTTPQARDALRAKLPSLATVNAPQGPTPAAKPKAGDPAPPIDAIDLGGNPWRLANQRGKVVLVYFWATWCGPCVAAQPALRDHFATLRQNDRFAMVSLSMDEKEHTLRRFVEKTPLPWPQVFIGLDSPIAAAWGTTGSAPHYFLVGPDGRILSTEGDWNQLGALAKAALDQARR